MTRYAPANSCNVRVQTEFDVVTLRQEVRQVARSLGIGLCEQAKISTALTVIARALLLSSPSTLFTIVVASQGSQPVLQISCVSAAIPEASGIAQIEQSSYMAEARLLVGDVTISCEAHGLVLKLCIPINKAGAKK
jgi:hypothetical protein